MVSEKTRSDIVRLTVLWVILSAIGEAVTLYLIGDYPGTASAQGEVTSEAVFFLLWVTIPVFVLVALIIIYTMVRFRVADDDDVSSEMQYRSGRAFPWGWVAISTILNVLFVIHPGLTGLGAIWSMSKAATDPIEVDVTSAQWQWRFAYPSQELANVAELVVPVDTPIRFVLRTKDVIHSFWVPAWGIKKAVIPGETRTLVVQPKRIVDTAATPLVRLQCSQICGVGHAEMRSMVRVVSRTDFDEWVKTTKAATAHGGMEMPGMHMPGMDMQGAEMAAPGTTPLQHETPGMDMHGTEMPGMDMQNQAPPHEAPMENGTSGMNMPATNAPEGAAQEEMPMQNDQMPAQSAPMQQGMSGMNMPATGAPEGSDEEEMPMKQNMPDGSNN